MSGGTKAAGDQDLPGAATGGHVPHVHLRLDSRVHRDHVQLILHELISYFQIARSQVQCIVVYRKSIQIVVPMFEFSEWTKCLFLMQNNFSCKCPLSVLRCRWRGTVERNRLREEYQAVQQLVDDVDAKTLAALQTDILSLSACRHSSISR